MAVVAVVVAGLEVDVILLEVDVVLVALGAAADTAPRLAARISKVLRNMRTAFTMVVALRWMFGSIHEGMSESKCRKIEV